MGKHKYTYTMKETNNRVSQIGDFLKVDDLGRSEKVVFKQMRRIH